MSDQTHQASGAPTPFTYADLTTEEITRREMRDTAQKLTLDDRNTEAWMIKYQLLVMRMGEFQAERQDRITATMAADSARMAQDGKTIKR